MVELRIKYEMSAFQRKSKIAHTQCPIDETAQLGKQIALLSFEYDNLNKLFF